jgi:sugar/nucleoside kinase (ribokinase family)
VLMPNSAKNIFVIGDLVIDHTVFVKDPPLDRASLRVPVYEVLRRLDTAGGAANCARILAVLNPGHTFLWGLIGRSNWGDFRRILEHCQAIDGAHTNIKFRGVQDETHAQMNTITRLVKPESIPSYGPPLAVVRFDDYGHVHISEDRRGTVLEYLRRIPQKYRALDAIVLNDLDMNCLNQGLIKKIADFANEADVPLFVNPKHNRSKYTDIEGTAMISSLSEWCHLVGQTDFERERLDRESSLKEIAQLSFQYLGNFKFHIIECGEPGLVLMAPHPEMDDKYAVYRIQPHTTHKNVPSPQLGCVDVMTAAFAMEFSGTDGSTKAALRALKRANAVLACYRDMPWQRMPSREAVADEQEKLIEPELRAEPSKGMLFLPKERKIMLSDNKHQTDVPDLFTVDATFRERVNSLIKDIGKGLTIGDPKSIILSAPSGTGKTTIMNELEGGLGERLRVKLVKITNPDKVSWNHPDEFCEELIKAKGPKADSVLVAIDEARKQPMRPFLDDYGVTLLDSAHLHNVRFLLIDADFDVGKALSVDSQIAGRCIAYQLPALRQRPMDIPYIVAGMVFDRAKNEGLLLSSVKCESKFLLSLINATISNPHLKDLRTWVREAYESAIADSSGGPSLEFTFKHLPKTVNPSGREPSDIVTGIYEFYKTL